MPTYTVRAPTGETYTVKAPPGGTEAQAIAYVQTQNAEAARGSARSARVATQTPAQRAQGVLAKAPSGYTKAKAALNQGVNGPVGANFADAMAWGHGGQLQGEAFALQTKLANLAGRLTGKPEAYTSDEARRASVDTFRERKAAEQKRHPVGAPVASVAGSIAAPGMIQGGNWVAGAKSMPAMIARSGALSGLAGAVYGHGTGEAGGTVRGGLAGLATGVVLPPLVAGGGKVLTKLAAPIFDPIAARVAPWIKKTAARHAAPPSFAHPITPVAEAAEGAPGHVPVTTVKETARARVTKPEVRAAEAIKKAMARDEAAGHTIDPTRPLRHAGGENVAALYDVVAQSPGPGRQIMREAIDRHRTATSAAIRDDIGTALGGKGDYFASAEKLRTDRAAAVKGDMAEAFAEPLGTDAFDANFGALMSRLPKGALEAARDIARKEGRNPDELGLTMLDSYAGHVGPGAPQPVGVSARDLKGVQGGLPGKNTQGRSLLDFIAANGGIKDEAGELAGRGVGDWHKGKPFRRAAVRDDGLTMEEMAAKAHAAGYFPDAKVPAWDAADNMHPVGPEDLAAAIDAEMSGAMRYARDPDPQTLAREGRVGSLEDRIRAAGVSSQGTADDVGRQLGEAEADLARLEAHADGPNVGMSPNEPASAVTPTLETMHYVKKGIDQTLEQYRNQVTGRLDLSGSPGAQADAGVRTLLGQAMRRASKPYDKAMASWGDDSDNIQALKLGRDVFSPKFDMQSENLARLHSEMSEEARSQFQKGVGEAIIAEVRKSGDIRTVRRLLGDNADEFKDRIALAFNNDPTAFGLFLESMAGRADDAARDTRFMGGSPTYGRQAARADLEAESAHPLDVAGDMIGTPGALAGKALQAALKTLPRGASRSAIGDTQANAALGRSATDPDEVTRLLNMLQAGRRIGAAPKLAGRLSPAVAGQTGR